MYLLSYHFYSIKSPFSFALLCRRMKLSGVQSGKAMNINESNALGE